MSQEKILVTGGAGYIGSHVVLALQQAGYGVVILDSLEYGHRDLVERVLQTELIVGNISDRILLDRLFAEHNIAAVMHFAAYALVGESMQHPDRYYRNNVMGTLTLLEAMRAAGIDKFVFSSTCSVYGASPTIPLLEDTPLAPINPYASSKLMVENILSDFDRSYGFRSVRFRYFNAAGADPQGRLGEDHTPETHLIPLVLLAALGLRKNITVFGTDYDTADGTCIRDYIHVSDLATAHVLGLKYLISGGQSQVFNLGNGDGFSVKEIIATAEVVTGKQIEVIYGDRRAGDPPILLGSNAKARQILDWQPQYSDITDIINHAWQWHKHRHISTRDVSIPTI
jgi:UDP-glucose 4-epimerase